MRTSSYTKLYQQFRKNHDEGQQLKPYDKIAQPPTTKSDLVQPKVYNSSIQVMWIRIRIMETSWIRIRMDAWRMRIQEAKIAEELPQKLWKFEFNNWIFTGNTGT